MTDVHHAGRPVVVTGLGAVTPYGVGVESFWSGLQAARSTARRITRFDPEDFAVQFACEVPDFDPMAHLPRKLVRQLDPFSQFALVATAEALGQAGLLESTDDLAAAPRLPVGTDGDRAACLIASGMGGLWEMTDQYERLLRDGPDRVRPYAAIALPVNMAAGQVATRHGLRGPSHAVVSACASGGDALGSALDLIRCGRADVVVAGGAESPVNPLPIAGFASAGALSRRNADPAAASRPFDEARDGFVAGEGAGIVVLESVEHARSRGARVLAELAGYGASNDAHHPTQPPEGGIGAAKAIRGALADAGLTPGDVDHINAHGTSTPTNDLAESQAIRSVFGDSTDAIPVTSTKSAIGHLMGAAGGVEAVATVMSVLEGVVPPSLNLDHQDPACQLDVVSGEPRKITVDAALSNSFGFGGHNAVLAFTSPHTVQEHGEK